MVLMGQHVASIVFGNSQYLPAPQQTACDPLSQMRLPEQQMPPTHASPLKQGGSPGPQLLFAATHDFPCGVVAQTLPGLQHLPLQQAALAQHLPPHLTAPSQPSQQHLPLTQTWFG